MSRQDRAKESRASPAQKDQSLKRGWIQHFHRKPNFGKKHNTQIDTQHTVLYCQNESVTII